MPEQPMTPFERRLAAAFADYVVSAPTDVDPASMTSAAVVAGARVRTRPFPSLPSRGVRLVLVAAALVALAGGILAIGGARPVVGPAPSPTTIPPTANPPTADPSTSVRTPDPSLGPALAPVAGAPAWEGVAIRIRADSDVVDIAVIRPDGTERVIRRFPKTMAGGTLSGWADVSAAGWLAVRADVESPQTEYALFDLWHPDRPVRTVLSAAPFGAHWSAQGLFAVPPVSPCNAFSCWSHLDILDPESGATVHLGPVQLFGGGPRVVWAADGTGILDGGRLRPADGSTRVDIAPARTFLDREVGVGGTELRLCGQGDTDPCPDGRSTISVVNGATNVATVRYQVPGSAERISDAIFAADDRAILATILRTGASGLELVVARIDETGTRSDLVVVPVSAATSDVRFVRNAISPDDARLGLEASQGQGPASVGTGTFWLTTDGARSDMPDGFIGWLPGSLAEALPTVP